MQAPVPYLNRALAEEQLGVDADERNEHQEAQVQYSGAVKVGLCSAWENPKCSTQELSRWVFVLPGRTLILHFCSTKTRFPAETAPLLHCSLRKAIYAA